MPPANLNKKIKQTCFLDQDISKKMEEHNTKRYINEMNNFNEKKRKPKKNVDDDTSRTLDEEHRKKINIFKEINSSNEKNILQKKNYKESLKKCNDRISKLTKIKKTNKNKDILNKLERANLEKKRLENEIISLEKLINESSNRSEEIMYNINNSDDLAYYYGLDNDDECKEKNKRNVKYNTSEEEESGGFEEEEGSEGEGSDEEESDEEEESEKEYRGFKDKGHVNVDGDNSDKIKRDFDNYLERKDCILKIRNENKGCKSYIKGVLFKNFINAQKGNDKKEVCGYEYCNGTIEYFHNEGYIGCNGCGRFCSQIYAPSGKSLKKDENDVNNSVYKRINHFNEIMSQIQAKEQTDIKQIVSKVIDEMNEECMHIDDLSYFVLKSILKKLKLCRAYEHTAFILKKITGKPPPKFTTSQSIAIKNKFTEIQDPFELFKTPGRQNFLNYSYVIHKICQLLGYDEFLYYFPLLKNPGKLIAHDKIWEMCCSYRGWTFIKSI